MKKILLFLSVILIYTQSVFSQCTMFVNHTDILCWYNYDGTATVNVTNGVPPFSYQWSNNYNGPDAFGLSAGTYYVTVTDNVNCVMIDSVVITSAPVFNLINDSVINVSCYGGNNGEAWITAAGGTPPYTYNWGAGENITHNTGLSEGYYYPSVTDSYGCQTTTLVGIYSPSQITWVENIYDTYCMNTVGSIEVFPNGGTPFLSSTPYTYQWSNGPTVAYNGFLAPGIYTVTVTDSLGCFSKKDYVLNDQAFFPQIDSVHNVTCNGMGNGNVGVTPIGGFPPYTYTWSNGANTPAMSNLGPGTYFLTVYDSMYPSTCPCFAMVTITNPTSLSDAPGHNAALCYGDSTGYINLYVSGGTPNQIGPPYNYIWSNGCASEYNTNLPDGTYTCTITDANNCVFIETITLTSPPQLVLDSFTIRNVSCYGYNDASIEIFLSGGYPPYRFSVVGNEMWDTVNVFTGLLPMTPYQFLSQDFFGCTVPAIDTIFSQPDTIVFSTSQIDPTCADNDGSINIIATGGLPPFSAVWDIVPDTGLDLIGIGQGTYYSTITDASGCSNYMNFTLTQTSAPAVLTGINQYGGGTNMPPYEVKLYLFKETLSGGASVMDTVAETMNYSVSWMFNGITPGTYFIKANLANPSLFPNLLNSYYDNTFEWQNATPIVLTCDDTLNVSFTMAEMTPVTNGNGSISGTVVMLIGNKSEKAVGEPVPGAEILIEQEPNDIPVQCAITDSLGRYAFSGLEAGSGYHLLVQIPGFPLISTYQNLTINSNDSLPNLNFFVDSTAGGGIFIDTLTNVTFLQNEGVMVDIFPNPFSSVLNVTLQLEEQKNVTVELFDVNGRKILEADKGTLPAGRQEIVLVPEAKLEGSCFVVIHAGNTMLVKKLLASPK